MTAAVWVADPPQAELTEEDVHRKSAELTERAYALTAETWPEIFAALTDKGKALFVGEILEALQSANGNPDPVARVAEAWWRTMEARASYAKNLKSIGKGRVFSSLELKSALKLTDR